MRIATHLLLLPLFTIVSPSQPSLAHLGQKPPQHHRKALPPTCPAFFQNCTALYHPEICCPESSVCQTSTNTLSGIFCCLDPPCTDTSLMGCASGTYACPASSNGGCCPWGDTCALTECIPGGGPSSASTAEKARKTGYMGDLDGDGLSGTQDPVEERPRTAYTEKGWKTGGETGTGGWMATTTRGRASGAQGELVNFGEATETATNVGQGERITPRRLWVLALMGTCATGWL